MSSIVGILSPLLLNKILVRLAKNPDPLKYSDSPRESSFFPTEADQDCPKKSIANSAVFGDEPEGVPVIEYIS